MFGTVVFKSIRPSPVPGLVAVAEIGCLSPVPCTIWAILDAFEPPDRRPGRPVYHIRQVAEFKISATLSPVPPPAELI